jgi:hypothetical protein
LLTNLQHGDLDLELDYMMAKGSNSGIYLQGRYEVQLLDSWGVKNSKYSDNGGIYERWDDSRGKGQEGYEGYAPRQSVSHAPGLWQHLKISFQAPRFDASGKKTENAKMLRIELNGVIIHENIELFGPTRGAIGEEAALGPLRIQGDHGAIAFRNIVIKNYDKPRPELNHLKYAVYKGKFGAEPDYKKLKPEVEGSSVVLSSNINNKLENEYLIRYTGTFKVKEPGAYQFNLNVPGGGGLLRLNNQVVIPLKERRGEITLAAGDIPFELLFAKSASWAKPAIGLTVAGPGIREYLLSDARTTSGEGVDPIWVEASSNTILRSFMDIPGGPRIVHAVNVGSPEQVHYTYDMDKGALVQLWRGGFVDATPMWHERGDGSSRPLGTVQRFGKPVLTLARLTSSQAVWPNDTTYSDYQPKGYDVDEVNRPVFNYSIYGSMVTDAIRLLDNGLGVKREISVQHPSDNLYARIAEGKTIEALADGLYLIDDKSYYLRINDAEGANPVIRDHNDRKELIVPVKSKVTYSILF